MKKIFVLIIVLLFKSMLAQNNADKILGIWYTDKKKAKVEVYKQDNKYFGKIISLKDPLDPDTKKPKTDKHNADVKKRNNPLVGLILVRDFVYDDGEWTDGKIYDPENGKEYSCYMVFEGDKLKVRGYIGFSLIGRTTYWTRN